ncbi:hypothetical protein O6H91_03G007800 [Diphasiastrum complanatum]|nr:hypothetical protein O6H91_03G007800 [Diphasiastrum complanatum]
MEPALALCGFNEPNLTSMYQTSATQHSSYSFGDEDLDVFMALEQGDLKDTEEDIFNLMNHLLEFETLEDRSTKMSSLSMPYADSPAPTSVSISSSEVSSCQWPGPNMKEAGLSTEIKFYDSDQRISEYSDFEVDDEDEEEDKACEKSSSFVQPPSHRVKQEEIQFSAGSGSNTPPPLDSEEAVNFPMFHGLGNGNEEAYNGIRLVHLLVACTEALSNGSTDLASVILNRINQLISFTGNTMQRVASYFCQSLQAQIDGEEAAAENANVRCETLTGAFQILHEICPYIKFAHYTANQAILEAFENEDRLHILDFDIMEGLQWPPLMEALATRSSKKVRSLEITAVRMDSPENSLYSSISQTGRRLYEVAASLGIPFAFHEVFLEDDNCLDEAIAQNLIDGEAVAVNCMFELPHMATRSHHAASNFLSAIFRLGPKVITCAEDALMSTAATQSADHFMVALHHYSAIFDSLEASLSAFPLARTLVEALFLAPRISQVVATATSEEAAGEKPRHWSFLLEEAGYQPIEFSEQNESQATVLLSLYKEEFSMHKDQHQLLLGWGQRPILAASVWKTCCPTQLI